MTLSDRIEAFSFLGETLRDTLAGKPTPFSERIGQLIETQQVINPWFTPGNVTLALNAIAGELTTENLTKWCSAYPGLNSEILPVNVGVVMAGNLPLAGFHDFLSVLISGNRISAKTSSKDPDLIKLIADILISFSPEFGNMIFLTDGRIADFDIVIATGSDNSSRYFEYYFGKYPHIIRKNRNSIAIIDGTETDEEIRALGTDIFSYFGLGCRNVSKLYLPEGYDIAGITGLWGKYSALINHNKYSNNYDFYKAVYLVNKENFTDTGYLILKESPELSSPVSVLYYSYYRSKVDLDSQTIILKDKIQCITGHDHIPFGKAQVPALWDYADGTDTLEFLSKKKYQRIL
jgi:hypothetical protein